MVNINSLLLEHSAESTRNGTPFSAPQLDGPLTGSGARPALPDTSSFRHVRFRSLSGSPGDPTTRCVGRCSVPLDFLLQVEQPPSLQPLLVGCSFMRR